MAILDDLRVVTMNKIAVLLCASAAFLPGKSVAATPPPVPQAKPVTETIFGTKVTDRYRYFEAEGPAVTNWMKAEGRYLLIVSLISLLATAIGCWRIQVSKSVGHSRKALRWISVSLAIGVLATGVAALNYDKAPRLTCAEKHPRFGC